MLDIQHYAVQVVDNSSAFRMTEGVPLCIPEVNAASVQHVRLGEGGIISTKLKEMKRKICVLHSKAQQYAAQVVHNSSAFRMTEGAPLCIPEVNAASVQHVRLGEGGIVTSTPEWLR